MAEKFKLDTYTPYKGDDLAPSCKDADRVWVKMELEAIPDVVKVEKQLAKSFGWEHCHLTECSTDNGSMAYNRQRPVRTVIEIEL